MRTLPSGATSATLVLLLTACAPTGGQSAASSPIANPPSPSHPVASTQVTSMATVQPTPAANPVQSAFGATIARGTARISVELLTSAAGIERALTGEGFIDLAKRRSDIRWSSADGPSREVLTEDGFWIEVDPGSWLAVAPGRRTPTSSTGLVLRGIPDLLDVTSTGTESLDGVQATRYVGTLRGPGQDDERGDELAADVADGIGLNDAELAAVADHPDAAVQVTLWIDDNGLIVQVMRSLQDAGPVLATSIVQLRDFGVAAPITSPSSVTATAQ